MSSILFLLVTAHHAPPAIFDACLTAHRKLHAASVDVRRHSVLNGLVLDSTFKVSFVQPHQLKLRFSEPQQGSKAASMRTYFLSGTQFLAYDEIPNESLSRTVPVLGGLYEQITGIVGPVDDAVGVLLSNATLKDFLANFKSLPNWQSTRSGGVIHLTRTAMLQGKRTAIAFDFDANSSLMKSVRLQSPLSLLVWSYSYGPAPQTLSYSLPAGTKRVKSFLQRKAPPKFADKKSLAVLRACRAAYSRLKSVALVTLTGNTKDQIWMDGAKFREKQLVVDWSYDGAKLILRDNRTNHYYRGAATRREILTYVSALGARVDPMMREFLLKRNPIDAMINPDLKVHSTGSAKLDGVPCDLVEISGPTIRVSLTIRSKDHLMESATTENLDGSRVLAKSDYDFVYVKIGPVGATSFVLEPPPGATIYPLSKLKTRQN